MTDRTTLYQLLFDVILELRTDGHEKENTKEFKLADLFHQFPHWLQDLDAGKVTADEVLNKLRERAEALKIERWLDGRLIANERPRPLAAG